MYGQTTTATTGIEGGGRVGYQSVTRRDDQNIMYDQRYIQINSLVIAMTVNPRWNDHSSEQIDN